MRFRLKKFFISLSIFIVIFVSFFSVSKLDFKANNESSSVATNEYVLGLTDYYFLFNGTSGLSDFVGDNFASLRYTDNELFFRVGSLYFNRIQFRFDQNYQLYMNYVNTRSGQYLTVVDANNVVNPRYISIFLLDSYVTLSQNIVCDRIGPFDEYINIFDTFYTSPTNKYNPQIGTYTHNSSMWSNLPQVSNEVVFKDFGILPYNYIIYSPYDIILYTYVGIFDKEIYITCNYILYSYDDNDRNIIYFLKSDFSDYDSLYFINEENTQTDYGYLTWDEIEYIYFPLETSIYQLSPYSSQYQPTSARVFEYSFSYDFLITNEPTDWDDFFVSIINVPVHYFRSFLNFELFGFNLFYTLSGIMTVLLVFWIIRKF